MNRVLRFAAAAMIFLGTYVLAWLPAMMLLGDYVWVGSLIALAVAVGVARHAWRLGPEGPRSVRTAVALGALLVGAGLGFVVRVAARGIATVVRCRTATIAPPRPRRVAVPDRSHRTHA
jgi:hypothetical protein